MTHEWMGGHAAPEIRTSGPEVDRANSEFYGTFPYPWRPVNFLYPADGLLSTRMLEQSVGDFDHIRLPTRPSIWVAGCGTNQAAQLALQFPLARIVASDLSASSLELCQRSLASMGMRNVTLRQESINDATYHDEFDYIVSTGVIHHNADPHACLSRIGQALKPSGIAEVMVYNTFHRSMCVAFQESLRLLGADEDLSWGERLALARRLGDALPTDSPASAHYASMRHDPDSRIADALMQPVERSYTVESFFTLCDSARVEPITYHVSEWDKARQRFSWNLPLEDDALRARYAALSDRDRWQISNLMLGELSPMLWFYLQRQDSPFPVTSEHGLDQAFLDRRFTVADGRRRSYKLDPVGDYVLSGNVLAALPVPNDIPWEQLAPRFTEGMTPREALSDSGLSLEPSFVNRLRIQLTTSTFPYLTSLAVGTETTRPAQSAALA